MISSASSAAVSPLSVLAAYEASSTRHETPCGEGVMVWREWGTGPVLVLLHGGYGSWRHWIRNIDYFKSHRRVLVPDLPGLGLSAEAPDPIPDGIGAMVAQGLAQLVPPSEPIDLVGFSFGSLVGSYVAGHVQKPLKSLTLVGAGALGLIRADITLERTDPLMSEAERRAVHAKNLGLLMIADPAQIDDLAITIQDLNVQLARVKSRRFAKSESLADVLRGVEVGALHSLWGEWDAVAAGRFSERETLLRAIRPDVSFKIIEQGGHWISYERADAFNAYVAGLLKS